MTQPTNINGPSNPSNNNPNEPVNRGGGGGGRFFAIFLGLVIVFVLLVVGVLYVLNQVVSQTAQKAYQPIEQANNGLRTQVAQFMNPTPTILPDPITVIHEIRSLARLETIQYTVEKVITAETNQNTFGFLFGDKLLFVAHGVVIAGVDLSKMRPEDMRVDGKVLYVRLPAPEVFIATLDNEKSYVYDRSTGILSKGQKDLETSARQAAEQEILKTAVDDGILKTAQTNAQDYMSRLLRDLGYEDVIFEQSTPVPQPTSAIEPQSCSNLAGPGWMVEFFLHQLPSAIFFVPGQIAAIEL
jgi:hypothetical protein